MCAHCPQNGNLPRTSGEWELEHLSNEYTWGTAAALYNADGEGKKPSEMVGQLSIQDAVMPGYMEEWDVRRSKVGHPLVCALTTRTAGEQGAFRRSASAPEHVSMLPPCRVRAPSFAVPWWVLLVTAPTMLLR